MMWIKRSLVVLVAVASTLGFTAVALAETIAELPDAYAAGWTLVRRVAPGVSGNAPWHTATDQLAGTQVYGTPASETANATFSINFDTAVPVWNEFLLITGDREEWMVMSRSELAKKGGPVSLKILATNYPGNPTSAFMYNRIGSPEDPWLAPVDHVTAINTGWILYGENSYNGAHGWNVLPIHNGANVFVRAAPEPSALAMLLGFGGIGLLGCLWRRRRS